jgi:hypothetical protein
MYKLEKADKCVSIFNVPGPRPYSELSRWRKDISACNKGAPPFLTLALDGIEWKLHTRGKSPRYTLDRLLCGPQSRYGRCGLEKNFTTAGIRTLAVQSVAHRCRDSD